MLSYSIIQFKNFSYTPSLRHLPPFAICLLIIYQTKLKHILGIEKKHIFFEKLPINFIWLLSEIYLMGQMHA